MPPAKGVAMVGFCCTALKGIYPPAAALWRAFEVDVSKFRGSDALMTAMCGALGERGICLFMISS
jgi:hypothetical protein